MSQATKNTNTKMAGGRTYVAPGRGAFYEFPWEKWGNWKYLVYAIVAAKAWEHRAEGLRSHYVHACILVVTRYMLFHFWCTLCRIPAIARKRQIQKKGMTFEQVDHEQSWENTIVFSLIAGVISYNLFPTSLTSKSTMWNGKGIALICLLHIGPIEWIYYWAHRALHHHYLYSRYHSHHHSSFVTQPITSNNHPMLELIFYHALFMSPLAVTILLGCFSYTGLYLYTYFVDVMNAWGHCNFEFVPPIMFKLIPPLKYLIYSPSFHSLHHSKVHTNFSLFMPLYDYIYGTMDSTSDDLHETSWKGEDVKIDCVYLTHMTDIQSIFHLPFGFQTFAAQPYSKRWHTWAMLPVSFIISVISWILARPFVATSHLLGKDFELQTWVVPRFKFQYQTSSERSRINTWVEHCILEAQEVGAKVVTLGLKNKDLVDQTFITNHMVNIPIVTGETLTTAIIAKSIISQKENRVFVSSSNSRAGRGIATYLCEQGINVLLFQQPSKDNKIKFDGHKSLSYASTYEDAKDYKVWIVEEEISKECQRWAPRGTHFYSLSPFPITKHRNDCTYEPIPGLMLPNYGKTINTCEDVMPRNVVRAAYAAGIVHALEGWKHNDLHDDISSFMVDKTWDATLKHGFTPYDKSN